jgi:putative endonuclease
MHRNWKANRLEIDIIARQGDLIVFVEVKARSYSGFGWPEEAVNKAKQQRIANAAEAFLLAHNMDNEIRFDIVSILSNEKGTEVYHIQDAFAP